MLLAQAHSKTGTALGNDAPQNAQLIGKAMIVQLAGNKFMLTGTLCHFTFSPTGNNQNNPWQYLKVEEGHFENGAFKLLRILNGDETEWGGPRIGAKPVVLQATLILQ